MQSLISNAPSSSTASTIILFQSFCTSYLFSLSFILIFLFLFVGSLLFFLLYILFDSYLSAWTLMGHEYMELRNTAAAVQCYRNAVGISEVQEQDNKWNVLLVLLISNTTNLAAKKSG